MELLSPCGNYQAFLGCINAGADAVYLAGSKYGARAYADNFTDDQIIEAIRYAHIFNVKVYLTVNTLIKEKEFNDVISYIKPFYEAGLDACIVQDIGLISVFNNIFPKMELHISTQGFSTGIDSVEFYKSLGAKRVVLAREVSLEEIIEIKNKCNIEIETFIHGAMCYSYSGQCLFSSCLGGRSGNRGRCAGPCRLEYIGTDSKNNKLDGYLLSMKDQCTLEILPKLIDAGIDSLKIEGRMKKPEYAAFVTSMYRKYIDLYIKNPNGYKVDRNDLKLLESFYMRSEIGTGYYSCQNDKSMLCINNPAYSKTSEKLIEDVNNKYLKVSKKIPLNIYVTCRENYPIEVNALIDNSEFSVSLSGALVQSSISRPLTENDIIKQFSKLGNSSFSLNDISVYIEGNCFVSVKELNEIRRDVIFELEEKLLESYKRNNDVLLSFVNDRNNISFEKKPIIKIMTKEQYDVVDSSDYDIYLAVNYDLLHELKDKIKKAKHQIIFDLPYITRKYNKKLLINLINENLSFISGYILNNWEEIKIINEIIKNKPLIAGPGLYTWNKKSIELINNYFDSFIHSYELSHYEINELNNQGYILTYGKLPLMQTANCIEKTISSCNRNKGSKFISLKDRKNYNFTVYRNCSLCYNTIFNSLPTSLHDEVLKGKINDNQIISFVDENEDCVKEILSLFLDKNNTLEMSNYTKGYYKRGVE